MRMIISRPTGRRSERIKGYPMTMTDAIDTMLDADILTYSDEKVENASQDAAGEMAREEAGV